MRRDRRDRKRDRKGQIKKNIGKKGERPLTDPYSRKEARNVAKSQARAEYGPTIRGAKAEKRGSVQRQKNIGQMFAGLQDTINQQAAATDASYAAANNALQAHMNAATQAALAQQGQIGAQNAATAALTGADPSLFAPTMQEGAAAADQRNIAGAALAAPIAQAGASQASYLRNTGINARRESIAQKQSEMKRRDKIKQDITALRKERAQKAVSNFNTIRGEEGDRQIQRGALKLDQKGQAIDARNAALDRAQDERASRRTAQNNARSNAQDERASIRSSGGEDGKGRTQSQVRSDRREQKNANIMARTLYQAAQKKPGSADGPTWSAFVQLLVQEGVEPWAAKRAVSKLKGKVGSSQTGPGQGEIHR